MRFRCDHCGKVYVADEKVAGRSFRMRCRQCGGAIVVKPAHADLLQSAAGAAADRPPFDPFADLGEELAAPPAHRNGHGRQLQVPAPLPAPAPVEPTPGLGGIPAGVREATPTPASLGPSTAAGTLPVEDEQKLGAPGDGPNHTGRWIAIALIAVLFALLLGWYTLH